MSTDTIYLNVQAINNNQTNPGTMLATINQLTNPIVKDLSKYDVFLQSLTLTTSDLPFLNVYRNIAWDPTNFTSNKMNLTITIKARTGQTPFAYIANPLLTFFDGNGNVINAGNANSVLCYLQYFSENANPSIYPNTYNAGFVSSQNYPRSYFNIHSVQQFLDIINNAISLGLSTIPTNPYNAIPVYFDLDPSTQLFSFNCPPDFDTSRTNPYNGLTLFVNSFLQKYLDGFRFNFYGITQNSVLTSPTYNGCDYSLVFGSYPTQPAAPTYHVYTAEYATITNFCDTHSIIITSTNGSLATLRQQVLPATDPSNINLPQVSCLKNIDIDFNALALSGINNCFLQYESVGLFFPVNGLVNTELNNINLNAYIMTTSNEIIPIILPAGGYMNIKFVLKKKQ